MHNNQEMLSRLGELLAIESVAGVNCSETAPYGAGPAAALDHMLKLCASLVFRVKNCDNQLGWAEIGEGEAAETIALEGGKPFALVTGRDQPVVFYDEAGQVVEPLPQK